MFLRKETRKVKTGQYRLVQFCKDCGSENIRLVCNKCGSHNIGHPAFDDILSNDKRGMHEIEEEKEFIVCKCDNCGIEFDGSDWSQNIHYLEGEFGSGSASQYTDYDEGKTFNLHKDLCINCMLEFINKLNSKIDEIATEDFIFEQLKDLKK